MSYTTNKQGINTMQPANSSNQISYKSFCQLGGVNNPTLTKIERSNGNHIYTTYHYVGYGQASWSNSKK